MRFDLNKNWRLLEGPMGWGAEKALHVMRCREGWMDVDSVPVDVTQVLIAHGKIGDPVLKDNSLTHDWVEHRSWWFEKRFTAEKAHFDATVCELVLESLDAEADVFLNGEHLGHQRSSFYPFRRDIKPLLQEGENVLLVRLTSGIDQYGWNDIGKLTFLERNWDSPYDNRRDFLRMMVRKPQYGYGWDWGPRAATCGIMMDVYLECHSHLAVRSIRAQTARISPDALVQVRVEVEDLDTIVQREGSVSAALYFGDEKVACQTLGDVLFQSGLNWFDLELTVSDPKLWWPNGYGDQPLYRLEVAAETRGCKAAFPAQNIGLRTLELDQRRLRPGERMFTFVVNGVPVFCKGGNWIPSDSIYCRVSDEKYRTLVAEAKQANFTMLRVWGGGLYERDVFYRACDEAGILVWQDFMMACAPYPDHEDWFKAEFTKEADYQLKRLRNHPALALWCGNNENHWMYREWMKQRPGSYDGGFYCYNRILPALAQELAPAIPVWRSSPYGGTDPNDHQLGDRHHWNECTMSPNMDDRVTPEEYDKVTSKFVSEYGYIGPCRYATIEKYFDGEPIVRGSKVWNMHNNRYEKATVPYGIATHYGGPEEMELKDYLLYASMVQGLMYHYSLTSFLSKPECSGGLFWMYNDTWGEVGWTIIDYYLLRKPSYYFVKRAFSPKNLILRRDGDEAVVTAVNDGAEPVSLALEYGYMAFDGSEKALSSANVELPAHFRGEVLRFPLGGDESRGAYIARAESFTTGILRSRPFKELCYPAPTLKVESAVCAGGNTVVTLSTDVYAHGVHLDVDDGLHLSDAYFDMLPGETRTVTVYGACLEDVKPLYVPLPR